MLTKVVGIVQLSPFQHHFLQFLTVLCLVGNASASMLEKADVARMTREAKEVQIGEVVSTWTSPDPDQKMYYTYVKVKVEKTLKGNKSQEIMLRQPGGSYGGITQKVFGMNHFQKGEKALFFITHANDGAPTVMFQGKHQIVKNPDTGIEEVIQEKSRDVQFVKKNAHSHNEGEHEKALFAVYDKRPLDSMMLEIHRTTEERKGDKY